MKLKICFIIILALASSQLYAQKEANNWFFGSNIGWSWNTTRSYPATGVFGTTTNTTLYGLPSLVSGSLMSTGEGCFSVSDEDGNLLFFSDGMTIWNKEKAIMQNGQNLTGHSSSAQSGIIIPYPESSTKYIAITLGNNNLNNISYSIVDMSPTMDGGKGAVDGTYKNVPLTGASGSTGESVTAVRHANKKDFWIIAPGRGTSTYLNVWKVTSAGVQAARHSVISVPGSTVATTACGYLRSSPNGKNVAWACGNEEVVTEKIKTLDVKISSCSLPVNHNISVMEY